VVNERYEIVAHHSIPTYKTRPFEEIVADMAKAARAVAEKAGLGLAEISSVGIGAPSAVDPVTKLLTLAPNLGWKNVPLAYEFKKHIDLPVYVANDADCAALGEFSAGAAGEYPTVLFITLGTGVGGGLIINGQIFTGASGYGFEPGHTTLVLGGVRCGCGREGCIEAYASVTALIRQTIQAMAVYPHSLMYELCGGEFSRVSGRTAFDAAKQGDPAGQMVVERYAWYVGVGISSLVTALRPHAVLVGGGISNEGDYLLDPVRHAVSETIYAKETVPMPVILKASLGNSAGIIGAALLETQDGMQ
jgi:glucokinase